jgi:uncharacterized membrane protein
MSEWLSKYWFSVAGACIFIAVTAYQLSHTKGKSGGHPAIWSRPSLFISLLLASIPVTLFVASTYQARHTELVFQAIFCLFISLLFFLASRFSERIALFAFLCWLSTSSVRPTPALWTRVWGVLFLAGAFKVYFLNV